MQNTKYFTLSLFLLLITAHTAIFWLSDIDLQVADFFYHPELSNPWPLGDTIIWHFFYQLGAILTMSIIASTLLIILLSSLKTSWQPYRIQAIFILLCFVIGPGLIVNTLLKENWGRPRPVHNASFGGTEQYVPPFKYNAQGEGNSFPSGHSSLGFGFIAFWFLWYKRRLKWANYALVFSLSLGCLFGFARMAAGGHFLSDVFWSLWIPLLTSMGLYHFFFKKYL
ncbi:MAG: phosphatase PAP2 family protein [Cocleimonas sp.]|nr:phosphatase PAP2 family protein [Cocleimonas sp.]